MQQQQQQKEDEKRQRQHFIAGTRLDVDGVPWIKYILAAGELACRRGMTCLLYCTFPWD